MASGQTLIDSATGKDVISPGGQTIVAGSLSDCDTPCPFCYGPCDCPTCFEVQLSFSSGTFLGAYQPAWLFGTFSPDGCSIYLDTTGTQYTFGPLSPIIGIGPDNPNILYLNLGDGIVSGALGIYFSPLNGTLTVPAAFYNGSIAATWTCPIGNSITLSGVDFNGEPSTVTLTFVACGTNTKYCSSLFFGEYDCTSSTFLGFHLHADVCGPNFIGDGTPAQFYQPGSPYADAYCLYEQVVQGSSCTGGSTCSPASTPSAPSTGGCPCGETGVCATAFQFYVHCNNDGSYTTSGPFARAPNCFPPGTVSGSWYLQSNNGGGNFTLSILVVSGDCPSTGPCPVASTPASPTDTQIRTLTGCMAGGSACWYSFTATVDCTQGTLGTVMQGSATCSASAPGSTSWAFTDSGTNAVGTIWVNSGTSCTTSATCTTWPTMPASPTCSDFGAYCASGGCNGCAPACDTSVTTLTATLGTPLVDSNGDTTTTSTIAMGYVSGCTWSIGYPTTGLSGNATIDNNPGSCYRLYFIDGNSVTIWSGLCTDQAGTFLNDGTVTGYNTGVTSISVS